MYAFAEEQEFGVRGVRAKRRPGSLERCQMTRCQFFALLCLAKCHDFAITRDIARPGD